jgi:hypothetical protein
MVCHMPVGRAGCSGGGVDVVVAVDRSALAATLAANPDRFRVVDWNSDETVAVFGWFRRTAQLAHT